MLKVDLSLSLGVGLIEGALAEERIVDSVDRRWKLVGAMGRGR